ncbi:MAG TPA: hypothetical protein VFA09_04115 [Ktedonobacteraceae bacterium]|nr:hypothetical protein [Ktedonobacteraceae bacterium]
MANEQQRQPPTPTSCPECGTMRVVAEGISSTRVHKPGSSFVPGITHSDSELWALVCPNCGYTTFYAKEPYRFA